MPRQKLAPGETGSIDVKRTETGWTARAAYRTLSGETKDVRKRGRTQKEARQALDVALAQLQEEDPATAVYYDANVSAVAESWLGALELTHLAPRTKRVYTLCCRLYLIEHNFGTRALRTLSPADISMHLRWRTC